ncbi:hypothetical protein TVAG_076590 [Trichomonas vaginalis G3]|uniref:receptor protein-tyrosine kinase n=1 Tax=Trichomonas vaginalis (strain ATCC PRA-98 / G3) TaxID=412133 RepID=A2D9Q6_TRIV3|nr:glycine-rich protein family [Trichomonas vaginalis G3]EAY22912.1 hypothetical protein TVAG_076590 [Trichomonas vaginalis G3]KAI5527362.1 glycine-rich protein family [Trichomonas vaginalis G3]|eukprot:XP_001583898.1 hypothetical protein [Trichomonas vaginalis G3]
MLCNFQFILIPLSNAITLDNSIPELDESCSFKTGNYAFFKGNYRVWCFGAKGGDSFANGGSGAKIFGKLILTQETEISIITGEIGADRHHGGRGGKLDGADSKNGNSIKRGGGGGSSSISIYGNKILVAAGGSGAYGHWFSWWKFFPQF